MAEVNRGETALMKACSWRGRASVGQGSEGRQGRRLPGGSEYLVAGELRGVHE